MNPRRIFKRTNDSIDTVLEHYRRQSQPQLAAALYSSSLALAISIIGVDHKAPKRSRILFPVALISTIASSVFVVLITRYRSSLNPIIFIASVCTGLLLLLYMAYIVHLQVRLAIRAFKLFTEAQSLRKSLHMTMSQIKQIGDTLDFKLED